MLTGLALGLGGGLILGAIYFGGLWLTVRRISSARHPGLRIVTSYLTRLAVLGIGFFGLLRAGGAPALLGALLGLLAARQLVLARLGPGQEGKHRPARRPPPAPAAEGGQDAPAPEGGV